MVIVYEVKDCDGQRGQGCYTQCCDYTDHGNTWYK